MNSIQVKQPTWHGIKKFWGTFVFLLIFSNCIDLFYIFLSLLLVEMVITCTLMWWHLLNASLIWLSTFCFCHFYLLIGVPNINFYGAFTFFVVKAIQRWAEEIWSTWLCCKFPALINILSFILLYQTSILPRLHFFFCIVVY